ncbi:hypothetical protein AG0111_0g11335 [Alternaria gaisen]|uniref:Uncharacterized protein n=1 Tax=Alternaria gaisen TaxID=167740 RepID=A0ACB6F734_9PLEO|nr:hypothetical protein AG0111_0g11335 [Alternaria gaisen]
MAIKAGDLVATVPGSSPTMISDGKRRTTGNTFYDTPFQPNPDYDVDAALLDNTQ